MMNLIGHVLFFLIGFSSMSQAQTFISVEGGSTWQSRNDQAVPGSTGTRFALTDISRGPFSSYRVYLGHQWNERHEFRFLYAPLALEIQGKFNQQIEYMDSTFPPQIATTVFYKFNSYRLTYAYRLEKVGDWDWSMGFTGKIRDAEVRLTQGSKTESKKNIGFVPLFHLQGKKTLCDLWSFRIDFDGLIAPQGRAFDLALFLERHLTNSLSTTGETTLFAGYRTVEGGADNDRVYNFAWLHTATIGIRQVF